MMPHQIRNLAENEKPVTNERLLMYLPLSVFSGDFRVLQMYNSQCRFIICSP